jgi:hypothetical protein
MPVEFEEAMLMLECYQAAALKWLHAQQQQHPSFSQMLLGSGFLPGSTTAAQYNQQRAYSAT